MDLVHFIPPRERRKVLAAAQQDHLPVVISGSEGTGKGAIAKWIHRNSSRSGRPFIEWKGHLAPAQALLEARGGSLAIATPEALSPADEAALKKVFQSRMVIDPQTGIPTLVQTRLMLLTAPNAGLAFIQEINRIEIDMPNLVDRTDEFEDIALTLLTEFTRELHKEHIRGIHHEAMTHLKGYDWPGNLRELRNVICLAVLHARGNQIELGDLPAFSHAHPELRAGRGEFERTYLEALMKVYDGRLEQISLATRTNQDLLVAKMREYGLSTFAPTLTV